MKVLILDYSNENTQKYGGVSRTLRALQSSIPDCKILNIRPTDIYPKEIKSKMLLREEVDIVLHSQIDKNLEVEFYGKIIPTCCWFPGQTQKCESKYILSHSPFQNIIYEEGAEIYPVVLGIPIPEFKEHKREDFLFQCSNHYPQIHSRELVRWCNYWHLKCYLAGPISESYDLLKEIDNINTFYLGEITEQEKIEYLQKAKGFVSLYGFPINSDSLAIKQALSYGCPILTTPLGNPHGTIKEGYNGFMIGDAYNLYQSFHRLNSINTKDCYDSVQKYTLENMTNSFVNAFQQILDKNGIS
jgi:hypothetical protein